jgi:uncharacterized protein
LKNGWAKIKNMKKRLRKKKHKGEFQEFGFQIYLDFKPNYSLMETELVFDEFIELIEKENLLFGGGSSEGFITAKKGSVSDSNRTALEDWIKSKKGIILSFRLEKEDAWV